MQAARWTSALLGALATACIFAGSALADSCGNPGYSYAGVVASTRVSGVSATISASAAPQVENGNVSGWIGIGRTGVAGKRGALRVGLLSDSAGTRLYFEVLRPAGWVRHLGQQVALAEQHTVKVMSTRRHPNRWRVWVDGRAVSRAIPLTRRPRPQRAMATAESWDGGVATCNHFRYTFGPVKVKSRGVWQRLAGPRVVEDPGYAVVQNRPARFLAANTTDVPQQEPGVFRGDWETGDASQWTSNQWNKDAPLSQQFAIVGDPVRQGNFAARFTVRPGDKFMSTSGERSEVVWAGSGESEGEDYWYSWSTLFPSGWSEPFGWGYFVQWHASLSSTTPPIAFNAREDAAYVQVNTGSLNSAGTTGTVRYRLPLLDSLHKGRWNDFIAHIHWSSGNDGSITVWHRVEGESGYAKVLDFGGIPTLQVGFDGTAATNYLKLGLYRDADTKTSMLYQDGFKRWQSSGPPSELAGV